MNLNLIAMKWKKCFWIIFLFALIGTSFLTSCDPTENTTDSNTDQNNTGTVTDLDGNIYSTITIGNQIWLASNLKTTKFKDGTTIPLITGNTAWINLISPGYCWYNNDATTYKSTYGALYNWYSVNSGRLCPTGWHVPSVGEWTTLSTYLGGDNVAGGKLKETGTNHWTTPNTGATNTSGFTAVPGGVRSWVGQFDLIGSYGNYWTSTEVSNTGDANHKSMSNIMSILGSNAGKKSDGYSVRCLKD